LSFKHEVYEIVRINAGKNIHSTVKLEGRHMYEKERFVIPRGISDKLRKRIRFMVVLKPKPEPKEAKKEPEPIAAPESSDFEKQWERSYMKEANPEVELGYEPVTLGQSVPISSNLLYTVESSTTLRSALSGLFNKPLSLNFGWKKIAFIGVIIVVAAVAYLAYTGQINFSGILKI
jgi:hypothetical protein